MEAFSDPYPFPAGGGQMGRVIRNYEWSTSPLGTVSEWPESLRALIQMMLGSRLPMVVFWGPDLITFCNDAFVDSVDGAAAQVSRVGMPARESLAEYWHVIGPVINAVMSGGGAVDYPGQSLPVNHGTVAHSRFNYGFSPLWDGTGAVSGVLLTLTQTLKASTTNDALELSEQRFQNLVREASLGIIVLTGAHMQVEIVNEAYARLIGRSVVELQGKNLFDVIPEASEPFQRLIDQVRLTGKPLYLYDQPYSVSVQEGNKGGFLDLVYQPYKELDGMITGVIVLCQEVTAKVLARQELQESEARLRGLVESAPFPIGVYVGEQMRIQLVNQSIIDVWGKGPDVIGKQYAQVLPELAGKGIYEQLDTVYHSGKPYHADNQLVELMIGGQLKPFYFRYSFTPLFDQAGKVYGVMNTATDVTELVIAQQQLRQAEASLRGAVELAQLGTWELDISTGQVSYSDSIKDWFGFDQVSTSLSRVYNPIHPQDRELVAAAISQALQPGSPGVYDAEYRLSSYHSAPERIVHARGKVVYDTHGNAYKLVGTAQDVTAERQREQALETLVELRTKELASANEELAAQNEEYVAVNEQLDAANGLLSSSNDSLQQFAYVAGHDLQEPLRKIQQFGDLLTTKYAEQMGDGVKYLERMQSAAIRMSALIRDLLDYSSISGQHTTGQPVSLQAVVETALTDLEVVIAQTGAKVEVGRLPTVDGNALQLGQLFQNLLSNALKFRSPTQATVIQVLSTTLDFTELPAGARPAHVTPRYYQIQIIDNGIGFDERHRDRIFQVFQRLHGKSEFPGTGIGLAICEKVMASHGGAITAASQPGQGSVFTMVFPAEH